VKEELESIMRYRSLSAQMRSRGYTEHDVRRRADFLVLADHYAQIADAWERLMPLSGDADSNR